jgi:hypothetical protein
MTKDNKNGLIPIKTEDELEGLSPPLVRQVKRGVIYSMSEDYVLKWERGELRFRVGTDKVSPVVHGRTGDGFNVSFA